MSELCLTLLCPPAVEEKLLDLLLLSAKTRVFTSVPIAAHGLALNALSQTEQVLGRSFATQVQVIIASADKEALLAAIRAQLAGAGLRYWTTPVVEAGDIA
jgi:soluble P-type ATPase